MKFILLLSIFLLSLSVYADHILSDITYTGKNLSEMGAVYPTRNPTINGESLVFSQGTYMNEKLLDFTIFPSSLSNVTNVKFTFNIERLTTENDIYVYLSDGINFFGCERLDQNKIDTERGTDNGNTVSSTGLNSVSTTFANIFTLQLWLNSANTMVTAAMSGQSVTSTIATPMLQNQGFKLIIAQNETTERSTIHSIRVEVTGVPEPSTVILFFLSIFLLFIYKAKAHQ